MAQVEAAGWSEDQGWAATRDGLALYWRSAVPPQPRALVVVVHGLAEHSGRYLHVLRRLAAAGYACYALDCRGHGRSPGPRVHVAGFDRFLWDVDAMESVARDRHRELPVVLLGHSQGGLVVLLHALRHPQGRAGVVASSPLLGVHPSSRPSAARAWAARVLSPILPGLLQSTGLDPAALSRDPAVVEAYRTDPLVSRRVSLRWFTSVAEAMAEAHTAAPGLRVPALVMAAAADRVVDAEATRRFVQRAPAGLVDYVPWEGLFHELFNEPQREQVLARALAWLGVTLKTR